MFCRGHLVKLCKWSGFTGCQVLRFQSYTDNIYRKKDTGRIYALKTLRKAHIISRSEVAHTLAERSVLAQINNPFIVPLKFSFQSPEKLYLVLAFVNGGELFHHLQREQRFDINRARFYTAELLCALECLHGFKVIYRDLKPENILLDYTGHIALCDFGLCKLDMKDEDRTNSGFIYRSNFWNWLTSCAAFCGTPEYLAPELLLGNGYTKSVDFWTLGVLLYEMYVYIVALHIQKQSYKVTDWTGWLACHHSTTKTQMKCTRRLFKNHWHSQATKSYPLQLAISWPVSSTVTLNVV